MGFIVGIATSCEQGKKGEENGFEIPKFGVGVNCGKPVDNLWKTREEVGNMRVCLIFKIVKFLKILKKLWKNK